VSSQPTSFLEHGLAGFGLATSTLPDDPAVIALVDRAVASRDQAAFAELYDCFLDRIYRYLYYRTASQADAEDLCEQVFMQAWAAIARFKWRGKPFQAWLYTLAHNALADHIRRARPTTSLDDPSRPIELASEPDIRELKNWMDSDMLAGAVSELSSDEQHVIVLRFLEGRDTVEVARMTGKREGAVRALQFRALKCLRRTLERHGERGYA
jgi:RNA polymerase sigma-70 factor (ECF subfamily)